MFFYSVFFKILLELSFVFFVVPTYSIFQLDFNKTNYILSWFQYLGLLLILPKKNKVSTFLYFFSFYLFLLPSLIYVSFCNESLTFLNLVIGSFLLSYSISFVSVKKIKITQKSKIKIFYIEIFMGILIGIMLIWIIVSGSLQYLNFDFYKIYENRNNVGDLLNKGIFSYFFNYVLNVAGVLLVAINLYQKKYFNCLFLFLLYVFFFGVTGHKQFLFNFFLILFLNWIFQEKKLSLSRLVLGLTIGVIFSLCHFLYTRNIFLADMLIRRLFFDTVQVSFTYFHFFSNNIYTYWSENMIFKEIFTYPYDKSSTKIISELIGFPDGNANASYFATGFMNAGYFGIVIYSCAVGILIRFLDIVQQDYCPLFLSLSSIICPFLALFTSADLLTSVLTHSLLSSCVTFLILQKTKI